MRLIVARSLCRGTYFTLSSSGVTGSTGAKYRPLSLCTLYDRSQYIKSSGRLYTVISRTDRPAMRGVGHKHHNITSLNTTRRGLRGKVAWVVSLTQPFHATFRNAKLSLRNVAYATSLRNLVYATLFTQRCLRNLSTQPCLRNLAYATSPRNLAYATLLTQPLYATLFTQRCLRNL